MKITKYKKIKNKYRVFFEDSSYIDLYEDIILKHSLLLKKEVDNKKLELIKEDNKKEEIYDISLKYISVKMRSKKEIRNYLKRKEYSNTDIDNVIKRLETNNIINDKEYARAYIMDRINLSNDGPNKIKKDLLYEGIEEDIINQYLNKIDNGELYAKLDRLIDKKIVSLKKYSGEVLKERLKGYFIKLGYNIDMIENILSNKELNNMDQGIKEYNKLYNKYSKKYEGYELENIIKQKLYQKGYNYNEIAKE